MKPRLIAIVNGDNMEELKDGLVVTDDAKLQATKFVSRCAMEDYRPLFRAAVEIPLPH